MFTETGPGRNSTFKSPKRSSEKNKMKVLLIYPEYPDTFWSYKYAIAFINKKAVYPPLGLITVAAMLPAEWEKKVQDLNVEKLDDDQLRWADYIFLSAMAVQRESAKEVIERCQQLGVKVVAGGPLFTTEGEAFGEVDCLVLDEAEVTLPLFLEDLQKGTLKKVYSSAEKPALTETPVPAWDLINMDHYVGMSIQYSRGCPFDCEFCDITFLLGRKPRLKNRDQFLRELDALYHSGWRGKVFIVDDNFIGNKAVLKKEILPALIDWMKRYKYPFTFLTEASINLADDDELLEMMKKAGFIEVFVGIETPDEGSLKECNKYHNVHRNLVDSVKKIHNHGMQVSGGFIVGFDSDPPSIFDAQINFIQQSGVITAMVGMLNAVKGSKLYERLQRENRLLPNTSDSNTDFTLNFVPKMNYSELINGYKKIVTTIYDPVFFNRRVLEFFGEFKPLRRRLDADELSIRYLKGLFKASFYLGILEAGRLSYWSLLLKTLIKHPWFLPKAVTFSAYGFHFRKVFALYAERSDSDAWGEYS